MVKIVTPAAVFIFSQFCFPFLFFLDLPFKTERVRYSAANRFQIA